MSINLQLFPWIPDSLKNEARGNKGLRGQRTYTWFLTNEKSEAQGGDTVNPIRVGAKWLNNKTPAGMFGKEGNMFNHFYSQCNSL